MNIQPVSKYLRAATLVLCLFGGCFVVQASEIGNSADVLEAKSWSFSIYGHDSEIEPKFKLTSGNTVSVPVTGGNSTLFSSANTEIEMEQHSTALTAVAAFRPRDGMTYSLRVGQVRDFDLEFSSGSQTNKLESTSDGLLWGLGMSGSFAPGSIVSTAVGWDLRYTQTNVDLDRFQGGTVVSSSDQKFRQEEYQGSIGFSRRWKMIEPYIGVKLLYVVSRLKNGSTKEKVSGRTGLVSPYAGVEWSFAERESFVVEGSLAGEKSLSAGLKVQF